VIRRMTCSLAVALVMFLLGTVTALAAGSRAGATRAAKRHTIAYVKRFGVDLRTVALDLQCSVIGRSRWKSFVYANGGRCTGTLNEIYSRRARTYRARSVDVGCGE
jgi:hypothetical protein